MAAKKPIEWAAIKKRYLLGEPPKKIAEDYGITAKQVSNKARVEGWRKKRDEISEKIEIEVQDDLSALCTATIKVHRKFMERMLSPDHDGKDMIAALEHPFLMDGEKVNSLYQTAMNNSVKVYLAAIKATVEEKEDEEAKEAGGLIGGVETDNI